MLKTFPVLIFSMLINTVVFSAPPIGVDIQNNLSDISQMPHKFNSQSPLTTQELKKTQPLSQENFWHKHKKSLGIGLGVVIAAAAIVIIVKNHTSCTGYSPVYSNSAPSAAFGSTPDLKKESEFKKGFYTHVPKNLYPDL